jgi:tetratricopeptide (TPR) repeat protein
MSHYSEDELTAYVINPSTLPNLAEMEAHIADCAECRDTVTLMEQTEADLRTPEVWQQVDSFLARPSRLEEALRLKRRMEEEDKTAALMLETPLSAPGRFSESRVGERVRFRTGGVLRALCKEAHKQHDKNPRYSLQLAEAACAIAAGLQTDRTTRYWHGVALRERANAFRYLGEFAKALKDLDAAVKMFDRDPGADPFDLAIVGYLRAIVLINTERPAEALPFAQSAVATFREYGDEDREASARLAEAGALHYMGRPHEATSAFEKVMVLARRLEQTGVLAYALHNAGVNHMEFGNFDTAQEYYIEAFALYDQLRAEAERARVGWVLGSLEAARGNPENAELLLRSSCAELKELGLRNDHALATLEWVEVSLALGRSSLVVEACKQILPHFESEGMMRNARMALAYLHEAAANDRMTPSLVREIRLYLKHLPQHPTVAFVPRQ